MPTLIVLAGIVVRFGFALPAGKQLETAEIAGVAVKSVPWAFLVSSIRFSCNSLTNNNALVTKIYFPKEIFPLGAILANLFDLCVASPALVVLLLVIKTSWSAELLWIPMLLLTMVLLATGIGIIVSAASLFFRDVKYIVDAVLTFAIFSTPIFYDTAMFGDKGKWLMLNPVAPILEGFAACITQHQGPNLYWLAYSVAFAMVAVLSGYVFFKHLFLFAHQAVCFFHPQWRRPYIHLSRGHRLENHGMGRVFQPLIVSHRPCLCCHLPPCMCGSVGSPLKVTSQLRAGSSDCSAYKVTGHRQTSSSNGIHLPGAFLASCSSMLFFLFCFRF